METASKRHWNQINRGQFIKPSSSNVQVHILQLGCIVAKSFMLHLVWFLGPSLMKYSVSNLKFCWTMNPFTYILASVLKSGKRPLRYLVYNKCLCEFTFNLDCTAKAKPVAKPYKHVAGNMKDKQFIGHSF